MRLFFPDCLNHARRPGNVIVPAERPGTDHSRRHKIRRKAMRILCKFGSANGISRLLSHGKRGIKNRPLAFGSVLVDQACRFVGLQRCQCALPVAVHAGITQFRITRPWQSRGFGMRLSGIVARSIAGTLPFGL